MSSLVYPSLPGIAMELQREQYYRTKVWENPGGTEQRVSFYSLPRYRYRLRYPFLRQYAPAPSPYQASSELGVVLGFLNTHLGAWDSFLFYDPFAPSNLISYSEPLLANLHSYTANVTQGSLTTGGLTNGVTFAAESPPVSNDSAYYRPGTFTTGNTCLLSVFVKMADNSVPKVYPADPTTPDVALAIDGTACTSGGMASLGGNLYRAWGTRVIGTPGSQDTGLFRTAAYSGKAFTASGFQLSVVQTSSPMAQGRMPHEYTKTSGSAKPGTTTVRLDGDSLSVRRIADQIFEAEFDLHSVLST